MRIRPVVLLLAALLSLSGCTSATYYASKNAQWRAIQRVAVMPFRLTFESPVRRQVMTQLFAQELRQTKVVEVVEVPMEDPLTETVSPSIDEIARKYEADAVFTGGVDDAQGAVVHVQLHDPAAQEVIWSGTYSLGVGAEFMSFRTQQQQFQRSLRQLARRFAARKGSSMFSNILP